MPSEKKRASERDGALVIQPSHVGIGCRGRETGSRSRDTRKRVPSQAGAVSRNLLRRHVVAGTQVGEQTQKKFEALILVTE